MARLNPQKLSVEFRDGVTPVNPIIPRRYTLTHSDITAELFLTIGLKYAYDKTTSKKDEVLGEWIKIRKNYLYYIHLQLDDELGYLGTAIRNYIFVRELPLALEAIRYGDRKLFRAHPSLNYAPIIVYFMSSNPIFNRMENWGNFMQSTEYR
ncbi:staygreen family protein [Clostridium hydrogenum]|uniref:staygreen family protein n=1 Tax=Clostridium hydrogenum TaxID=2855764 RepID=UPI001F28CA09|nr:staygreen family protein [Clostridium hydrogenum]